MSPPGILFNVRHRDFKNLWPWMLLFFFKEAFPLPSVRHPEWNQMSSVQPGLRGREADLWSL